MNSIYPLRFKPIFKEKIWGGTKIKSKLGLDFAPLSNCGEAWMISGVKNECTVVENGFLAGNELNELIEIYMGDLVGEKVFDKYGDEFPILIKYIDSNDYLSVQVHPDDELAMKRHQCYGKTEMWFINQADPNAVLVNGFSHQTDKESFLNHLKNKSIKEILRTEPVKDGDVFFIPAGRIHALGPGLLLTEIQQTSDITYRVYDWDRQSNNGIARELHVDLALDVIDFSLQDTVKTTYEEKMNQPVNLAKSPYFTTNLLHLNEKSNRNYHSIDSFKIYICQEGSFKLKYADHEMIINKSECILVPAVFEYVELHPLNSAKILEIYID